jgi:site-specific recombinase XerD
MGYSRDIISVIVQHGMSLELIKEFINHLEESGKSKSTLVAYKKDLHQLHDLIDTSLHETSADQLNATVKQLQDKHNFTPKTVSRKINSYRTFYKFLISKGVINENPAEAVAHPKFAPKPPRVLSQMEYLALREVSRGNTRLRAMIEMLLQTGIRIGELSRLKISHISYENGHIVIEAYSSNEKRHVPINSKLETLLQEYLTHLGSVEDHHPLFPTRDGNHIIIRNIRSSIDRAMAKAGIEDACVNDLRNTFIVSQLKAGIPIDYLAQVVGHKSKTTTSKYVELLESKYKPTGEIELTVI